jgi:hypothetical protein
LAITTFDQFVAANKQAISLSKLAGRTSISGSWFSLFDVAGSVGAGVLAGTSTTAGVVPTDATTGFPNIQFSTGTGYLAQVNFGSTVACRMRLADVLFKAGAYAFTAGTTALSAQPSYSSRVPSGTDFSNTEIWVEVTTAFATGTAWQVQVTYTNQAGTAARTTVISVAAAAANLTLGRKFQLALQAGDTGVQKPESVIVTNGGTAMTAGNFNILVQRTLWSNRVRFIGDGGNDDLAKTGMPIVYPDSALDLTINPDSTSTGIPEVEFIIANG